MSKRIYLAGPITGLTHDEARYGWRQQFVDLLKEDTIECFSPMRGKETLAGIGKLSANPGTYGSDPISQPAGIVGRDGNDVRQADAVVACFLESGGRPSLGTAWEIGIAHDRQIPIVCIALPGDPNRDHVILGRCYAYSVETLDAAVRCLRYLLLPGV
jgi:nucleoside 2-deoxyribosyltransferase